MQELTRVQRLRLGLLLEQVKDGTYAGRVPGEEQHNELVYRYSMLCWHWGWEHAKREEQRLAKRRPTRYNIKKPTPPGVLPVEAIAWAKSRVVLQGNWNRDLDSLVSKVIAQAIEDGDSVQMLIKTLRTVFPTFSKARLENIARTETGAAYNNSRLLQFLSNDYIVGFQFSAVLDSRTTAICQSRHGRIMLKSDPQQLLANTPPLHFMCRSVLVPVDRFDFEDLQAGKREAIEDYFGWVGDGPSNLQQALDWSSVTAALEGFGAAA